jgi:hypothetical protein
MQHLVIRKKARPQLAKHIDDTHSSIWPKGPSAERERVAERQAALAALHTIHNNTRQPLPC